MSLSETRENDQLEAGGKHAELLFSLDSPTAASGGASDSRAGEG